MFASWFQKPTLNPRVSDICGTASMGEVLYGIEEAVSILLGRIKVPTKCLLNEYMKCTTVYLIIVTNQRKDDVQQ